MSEITQGTLIPALRLFLARGWHWIAVYSTILIAWGGVVIMARGLPGADLPVEIWESLCLAAADAKYSALYLMWALMVLAMMLPTFLPTMRTYDDLRIAGAGSWSGSFALVAGYVLVWTIAAGLGAWAQWFLSRTGYLSPLGQSLSPWLTAALLVGAGLYQFSRLKEACLSKCRMPMTFFMERWQPGPARAVRMGIDLGVICLGCCWALMGLGFVGGTMALGWMGAATLFMTFEKLPAFGRYLTRPAGVALIIAAPVSLVI